MYTLVHASAFDISDKRNLLPNVIDLMKLLFIFLL